MEYGNLELYLENGEKIGLAGKREGGENAGNRKSNDRSSGHPAIQNQRVKMIIKRMHLELKLLVLLFMVAGSQQETRAYDSQTVNGITWNYQISNGKASVGTDSSRTLAIDKSTSGNITIPSTLGGYPVTRIGENAFYGCKHLTLVTIPEGVTNIGNSAFSGCSGMTNVTIPEGITRFGNYAFSGCSGLTCVTIPGTMKNMGNHTFSDCRGIKSITIPNGVTGIRSHVFSGCIGLESVTIPDSVLTIGIEAFYDCRGLTSATMPDSVLDIGEEAFYGCRGLANIVIGNGVTNISSNAFASCLALECIDVGTNNSFFASEDGVLYNKYKTSLLLYPTAREGEFIICNSVTNIKAGAFSNCKGLTSVTIPDSVEVIEGNAFGGCLALADIHVGENNAYYASDDGILFDKNKTSILRYPTARKGEYSICGSVTSIAAGAFSYCDGLTNVTIPNSVELIGGSAFFACCGLTTVVIPDSVTNIEAGGFSYCEGLTSVMIPDSVECIGSSAFAGCKSLTNVAIGNSVESIGGSAFYGCNSLTNITIPDSVISIGSGAFPSVLFDTNSIPGVSLVDGWAVGSKVLSGNLDLLGIRGVAALAFSGCIGLRSVTIGNGARGIGNGAFSESGVINIIIPESVKRIDWEAFFGCVDLKTVTIGNGVTNIGGQVFSRCTSLTNVTIPDSVTSIGIGVFSECSGLLNVTLPANLTNIPAEAFYWCTNLTSVTLPNSVTEIDESAFSGCLSLTNVTVPEGVMSIGDRAFFACGSLMTVKIPEGVTSIGEATFDECRMLESVTIPRGVTNIGNYAFSDCTRLTSLTIPWKVLSLGRHAFARSGLEKLSVPEAWQSKYIDDLFWCDYVRVPSGCEITYYAQETPELTTTSGVPYSWLAEYGLGDGTAEGYKAAAKANAANSSYTVAECFVAGLNPIDELAEFKATIRFNADGTWKVEWNPDLNQAGTKEERVYRVEGKKAMTDDGWTAVTNVEDLEAKGWRFFRVGVKLEE